MRAVFWLYPDRLAGRPGPGEVAWQLEELARGGIDTIVSLASGLVDPEAARQAGIQQHCWALPDDDPASAETERICGCRLPPILESIHSLVSQQRRVLVHCVAGNDRTGLVLAAYAAREENLDATQALAVIRSIRSTSFSTPGWEPMSLRIITSLAAGKDRPADDRCPK